MSMEMGICKLCGKLRPLIKAHIIPHSLYRPILCKKDGAKTYSNRPGVYPQDALAGIYDRGILCEECDGNILGPLDQYAATTLVQELQFYSDSLHEGKYRAYVMPTYDYSKLKLFFLSVMWRAGISTQGFFAKVNLGPHETIIRNAICSSDAGSPAHYAVTLAKFDSPEAEEIIINPYGERWGDINYYRFMIAGFTVWIKVDSRLPPYPLSEYVLTPDKPLIIARRPWKESREWHDILHVVATSNQSGSGKRPLHFRDNR